MSDPTQRLRAAIDDAMAQYDHRPPVREMPVEGESGSEKARRWRRNKAAMDRWHAYLAERCECGMTRSNVVHEMDPENSPEGPEYHADFAHHPFRESQS